MTLAPPLPGLRFEAVPAAAAPVLPRMDVAAFVGFAAQGPLHVPVPIDDVVGFDEVFGPELRLAWDRARGEWRHAHLAATVREFFRNGGRRCWVVRVAEAPAAAAFRVPGLLAASAAGVAAGAWMRAASGGSWADSLSLNATLLRRPIAAATVERGPDGLRAAGAPAGTLLRLAFPGSGVLAFFAPSPADPAADRPAARAVPYVRSWWFREIVPAGAPTPAAVEALGGPAARTLALLDVRADAATGALHLDVPLPSLGALRPGCWLRALPADPPRLMLVDAVLEARSGTAAASPPDDGEVATLVVRRAWQPLPAAAGRAATQGLPHLAAALSLELWARAAGGSTTRLAEVGLVGGHADALGAMPMDDDRYAPLPGETAPRGDRPVRRFPLAAPPEMAGAVALLPLGVPGVLDEAWYQPALLPPGTALERDGLARFSPALFLDPALADAGTATLLDRAFRVTHPMDGQAGRAATGLHALLPLEEVSIVAAPDAVHGGWDLVAEAPADESDGAPAAPRLAAPDGPDAGGAVRLAWSAPAEGLRYVVEESPDPRFSREVGRHGVGVPALRLERRPRCPTVVYVRVRGVGQGGGTPWSNTRRIVLAPAEFEHCDAFVLDAPRLDAPERAGERLLLRWRAVPSAASYRAELSADPAFAAVLASVEHDALRWEPWLPGEGVLYARVAASGGGVAGPWSETRSLAPRSGRRWLVQQDTGAAATIAAEVHRALLVFCAARGDATAVLSLPAEAREAEALAHVGRLDGRFDADEAGRTLSFGALYHPWPVVGAAGAAQPLRAVPPDGAAAGVTAARAAEVGAWAAPAHRPAAGVLALEPRLPERAAAALLAGRVNPLVPRPRGFVVLGEATLSREAELSGVGVRRLLILLRRLALREGDRHVFQPNDEAFRWRVQRHFEEVLGLLYARGAFAGATHAEAYRVVADASVNPRSGVEAGRLVVELRVAPSRPLQHLVVRLVQSGAGLSVGGS